jgi:divalent metal cation (Fe/Co/Zn/Cd) transporter
MAAAKDNLSGGFKREELESVIKSINSVSGVKSIKDIRARVHGNNILLDVIVHVESDI